MKSPAMYVKCPGYENNPHEHDMRDYCWTCAPFWENVPLCPKDSKKLTGTGFCKVCRKHYIL